MMIDALVRLEEDAHASFVYPAEALKPGPGGEGVFVAPLPYGARTSRAFQPAQAHSSASLSPLLRWKVKARL
jgi:hypothetical protein